LSDQNHSTFTELFYRAPPNHHDDCEAGHSSRRESIAMRAAVRSSQTFLYEELGLWSAEGSQDKMRRVGKVDMPQEICRRALNVDG
jgi:hypothetical protein